MLWCEIGRNDTAAPEHLAVFVSQLAALGVAAGIDARTVPAGLNRNVRFDLAPYLLDSTPEPDDQVAVIAADRLTDARLVELRRLAGTGAPRRSLAFGNFASRQAIVGVRAKLSYVFGQDPRVVNLADGALPGFDQGTDCPVFGVAPRSSRRRQTVPRPRVLLAGPALGEPGLAAAVAALALSRQIDLAILTDGPRKQAWIAERGTGTAIYNYGELLPVDLAEQVDVLACFAPLNTNYRLQCLVADLAVSGAALLDCTADHGIVRTVDAFVRAPADVASLAGFVTAEIGPNLGELAAYGQASGFARRLNGARVARLVDGDGAGRPAELVRQQPARPKAKVVFMPTNGVGLGHAQRCTLIAGALDRGRVEPVFAAFPSCLGLIRAYGFDAMPLVQRTPLKAHSYENDLVNYVRLRALTAVARTLVFDGGFVFDSVFRTIAENRLQGVWIRRGLWPAHQDNSIALDRGKAFARVIVPEEAFEELNDPPRWNDPSRRVGPIVQRPALDAEARARVRADLAERFGLAFERLVVTQLGAGVAADRGAQIQTICGILDRRPDVLHLVLVWPTATLQPGWFGWRRSQVVRTRHGAVLAAAADLCISAAGYNSFNEIVYGALPAILIPQTATFMDDQRARARAAHDRGLVGLVEPHELMTLDRQIGRFLDGEGAATARRLAETALPEPGTARAAALIEEVADGQPALERPVVADRSPGRL